MKTEKPRQPLPPTAGIGPCPVPSETEAREALAMDLARGDLQKAAMVLRLPLFRVALEGSEALG